MGQHGLITAKYGGVSLYQIPEWQYVKREQLWMADTCGGSYGGVGLFCYTSFGTSYCQNGLYPLPGMVPFLCSSEFLPQLGNHLYSLYIAIRMESNFQVDSPLYGSLGVSL